MYSDEQLTDMTQYTHSEPQQDQAPQQEQPRLEAQESQKDQNFRNLRERAEAAERRSMDLERMMQANMSGNQQGAKIEVEDEDDDFVGDDSYVEGKQLKKYVKNLKRELKDTKKQFQEFNEKSSLAQAEMSLKQQFNDFDQVVCQANLEKLSAKKPALYRAIMANNNIYDRGYTAYELIKSAGLTDKSYEDVDRRLEENRAKPRSAANASPQTGETPLARVGDYDRRILTEERKEQLRAQVEEAKRNRF